MTSTCRIFTRTLFFCIIGLVLLAWPATAQQGCTEIDAVILQCDAIEHISGEPPNCACNGMPIDPPLELTCARNFGCADPSHIGTGNWPECWCRAPKDTAAPGSAGGVEAGGVGSGVGSSLGGADTCEMFFTCPSGSHMEVRGGMCSCIAVMLPAVTE